VFIETSVGNRNQVSVEAALIAAGFVASDKDDRFSVWIEREGGTPLPVSGRKTQFLHVRMPRTSELVRVWPRETGAIPS
jgi:hypothetical protein